MEMINFWRGSRSRWLAFSHFGFIRPTASVPPSKL